MSISTAPAAGAPSIEAGDTLFFGGNRIIRVFGKVGDSDKEFELILPDNKLRAAMLIYARNIALLSLLVSAITATPGLRARSTP